MLRHRPNPLIDEIVGDLDAWKRVVPKPLRRAIVLAAHEGPQAGHLGITKTLCRVAQKYFWPTMTKDVTKLVSSCDRCQRVKVSQRAASGLLSSRKIATPWHTVAADVMGPFPRSKKGYQYVIVFQDLFTRWVEVWPLRRATGPTIAEAFEKCIVNRWGTPSVLLTDNGTEFVNTTVQQMANRTEVQLVTTPPYTPRCNPVERANRILKTMMCCFISESHKDWDVHLPSFQFAMNSAYQESLQSSPAFLNLGRELTIAELDISDKRVALPDTPQTRDWRERMVKLDQFRKIVQLNLGEAREAQQFHYNLRHRHVTFGPGQLVLMRQRLLSSAARDFAGKLAPRFTGPCQVLRALGTNVYRVRNLATGKNHKVPAADLKLYRERDED